MRWLTSSLTRALAVGWAGGLALVYLIRYDGWLLPFTCARFFGAYLASCQVGPFFGQVLLVCVTSFGFLAALIATACGLGAVVAGRLLARNDWVDVLLALAVGLWLLAVGILVLGAWSVAEVRWVFLASLCWLAPAPRKLFRSAWSRSSGSGEPLDTWSKLTLILVMVAAVATLPGVLVPPFEYDELEYHLGAPTEYQRAGHIVFLPHNFLTNMPQLTEMLYLLAVTTTSDIAAKLVHWALGLLTAFGVYAVGTRLWTRRVGLTAAMLFYCMPFIQDLSQTARIDLATAYFAVLSFGALLVWTQTRADNGYLWFSAIMTGIAIATKWTAVAVVLLPALVFLGCGRTPLRLVVGYGVVAVSIVSPWLLKNFLFTGNPVYPLLSGVFQSPHWGPRQAALLAPYEASGWTRWKELGALVWQYSITDPFAAPVLLMTAPLILLLRRTTATASRAVWLFVAAYAGWFLLTNRPWRFLVPTLPLAAMGGAYALHALDEDRLVKIILRTSVVIVVAVGIASLTAASLVDAEDNRRFPPRMSFLQYVLGQTAREEFIERMGGGMYEPILWMNEHLPTSARVLYVGEARTYYARRTVLWSTAFDQPVLEVPEGKPHDARSLFDAMRALSITHIYVNNYELARLRRSYGYWADIDRPWLKEFLGSAYARPIHVQGPCTVYELKDQG